MKTDYAKFTAAAKELGAEKVKTIGRLDDSIFAEAWRFNGPPRCKGEGFILAHNTADGTIGVYQFVGIDGAGVEADIKWLMAMYSRIAEGKAA